MERANTFSRVGYGTDRQLLSNVCWIHFVFKLQPVEWFQMERNFRVLRNRSWRNRGISPCLPPASTGLLQPCTRFVGDFSQGSAMASVDRVMSPTLEDLTAGASLLVTCLHFLAVEWVPSCTLTKPLDNVKGCLSPAEDHV